MFTRIKRLLIGRPLKNEALKGEKLDVLWGLPLLSSDAISSVAYAGHEILIVLLPAVGMLAFTELTYISGAIIALLAILVVSYRQTIDAYPNGGGAFIVAKENIGLIAGVTAGSALSIGYILTVAVSIASGIDQITSAFTALRPYNIYLCFLVILVMTLGNLRGVKESARIFSIPTYLFVFSIILMLIVGIVKILGGYKPQPIDLPHNALQPLTLLLILKAFTNGCAALTGVEAVSNSVPDFREPSTKNAKTVLVILASLVLVVFGGTSIIANFYPIDPNKGAMLVQIAEMIFGRTILFYIITALSFAILVLAANTAFVGFPNLISVMAKEGYVPRQLSMRGDRLSFSNGIIVLSTISMLLILVFKANVTSLIGLYAIAVFISFTLSQSGMFARWIKNKGAHWKKKAITNGFGALVTLFTVIIIAITKFTQGAWLVVILIPLLIFMMLKVKKHYIAIYKQLKMTPAEISAVNVTNTLYRNRVIVPIESVNRASIRALRYARTISDNVVAFNISTDEDSAVKIRERYGAMNTDIPLIIKYSPFRKVVDPLVRFIQSEEYDYQKGDIITVILPQFVVRSWWQNILHNHTRVFIERELLKHKHIVVSTMPLQMKDDEAVLKSPKYRDI